MKVLVVEDDEKLAGVLVRGLRERQIEGARARTVREARSPLLSGTFDVVILDIMLPDGSGLDLCRAARDRGITTPILMLTARDTIDDRVVGLESGADDYMVKPFAIRELNARIDALGRRQPALRSSLFECADFRMDRRTRRVTRAGRLIELTAKEFSLLEYLVSHAEQVVDRASITATVWDENHDPCSKVIEVLIARVRRKIDDGFTPKLIQTLRGAGYRFGVETAGDTTSLDTAWCG
jgi:two-component system copper resistance phosphate regulon response regulator CusR